jgi:putative ABC transport system permease protein
MLRSTWADLAYAAKSMWSSRLRAVLTTLGIVIGVMSVLAVAAVGESAQGLVTGQISSLGSNLIGVVPGGSGDSDPPPIAFGVVTATLKADDVEAIVREVPHVVAGSSYVNATDVVQYRSATAVTTVRGVSEQLPLVEDTEVASGRFLAVNDVAGYARVMVLGSSVAEELFGSTDPLGLTVRLGNSNYEVIGVAAERGSAFFQDQDDLVYVPYTTAQKLIAGIDYLNFARVKVDEAGNVARVQEDIRRLLRRRHHVTDPDKDDFSVRSVAQALDVVGQVTGVLKMFVLAVTAISLLVGGINIMNIMYVTVRERTREIGLRKALGASERRILAQFIVESVLISVVGGAAGILLGIGVTYLAAVAVRQFGYDWAFIVPPVAVAQAVVISVGVGLVFGIAPARAASRLEPINALRYE